MWIRVNSMLHLFEWLLQLGNGDVVVNGGFAFGQHKKEENIQARGLGDNLILELRSTDSRLKTPTIRWQCKHSGRWRRGNESSANLWQFCWLLVHTSKFRIWQIVFATKKLACQFSCKCICHLKFFKVFHAHVQRSSSKKICLRGRDFTIETTMYLSSYLLICGHKIFNSILWCIVCARLNIKWKLRNVYSNLS